MMAGVETSSEAGAETRAETGGGPPLRLVVVGAGPAGYPAAFLAADLGMDVTLVDEAPAPGGVCLRCGCIPSKALLHVARLMDAPDRARACGVDLGAARVDLPRVRAWRDGILERLGAGLIRLAKDRKVRYIQGRARFESSTALVVTGSAGEKRGEERLACDRVLVATGSRPAALPNLPGSPAVWDSTAALALPEVPERLLVVGGGYIGLEAATIYAALGSKVTVVEATDGLLPGADRDLVGVLSRRLGRRLERVLLKTRVEEAAEREGRVRVRLVADGGASEEADFDRLLVSVGRRPNGGDLGLERTSAGLDARGFVEVDGSRRSADPAIYAAGDVAGEPMLAHKATHEGRAAVEAIAGRRGAAFAPAAVPAVVFTDPEIAWCGLTETEAKRAGRQVSVGRFPWGASGRAMVEGAEGVTKVLTDPGDGAVLGVGIAGAGAGDLVAEAALALEMGASAEDIALTIHAHPTLSETLMEAAEAVAGHATHLLRPKR